MSHRRSFSPESAPRPKISAPEFRKPSIRFREQTFRDPRICRSPCKITLYTPINTATCMSACQQWRYADVGVVHAMLSRIIWRSFQIWGFRRKTKTHLPVLLFNCHVMLKCQLQCLDWGCCIWSERHRLFILARCKRVDGNAVSKLGLDQAQADMRRCKAICCRILIVNPSNIAGLILHWTYRKASRHSKGQIMHMTNCAGRSAAFKGVLRVCSTILCQVCHRFDLHTTKETTFPVAAHLKHLMDVGQARHPLPRIVKHYLRPKSTSIVAWTEQIVRSNLLLVVHCTVDL